MGKKTDEGVLEFLNKTIESVKNKRAMGISILLVEVPVGGGTPTVSTELASKNSLVSSLLLSALVVQQHETISLIYQSTDFNSSQKRETH